MLHRLANHLGAAPAPAAVEEPSAPGSATPAAAQPGLSPALFEEFQRVGFVVARNLLTPAEVRRLGAPIHDGFKNHLYEGKNKAYPDPSARYSLGSRVLLESPDVAGVSCDHPQIVAAVEQLLGGPAVLSQYQSYLSPPGYDNAGEKVEYTPGHGTHYDYKPFRPVGSFLNFLFAVCPLSDYTPEAGPLLLARQLKTPQSLTRCVCILQTC